MNSIATVLPLATANEHGDFGDFLLVFSLVLLIALLARASQQMKIPRVVVLLLGGMCLSSLRYLHDIQVPYLGIWIPIRSIASTISSPEYQFMMQIGLFCLMLATGLEHGVEDLKRASKQGFWVALIGVIMPIALGWYTMKLLLPELPWVTKLFVGASLSATSIGVVSAVMKELGITSSKMAMILLATIVIDDVMGLTVLSTVDGLIQTNSINPWKLGIVITKSIFFIGITIVFGERISEKIFGSLSRFNEYLGLKSSETHPPILVEGAIIVCVLFCLAAEVLGLHFVIGAFAGGLVLAPEHYSKNIQLLKVNSVDYLQ